MTALGFEADRLVVLIAQMVSLFQNGEKVKMSKRTGKAVTMEDLMDEVGVDPIRYFFAMRSMDSHLDFDMDLAVSQSNENPVFYVQYAHARICSIFRQAEEQNIAVLPLEQVDLSQLTVGSRVRLAAQDRRASGRDRHRGGAVRAAPADPLCLRTGKPVP